ncbi:hypothetical protein TWF481_009064 [Arthrobotrys musiformis]|uniref:HNH nuclease domain-containing protein n=1 Tax=Arthrobotrys musiformis TaxID=47236 RepID=A0AAV9W4M7_9PEZI
MPQLEADYSQTATKRVTIRPSIEIIKDIDCLLYLLSGLDECDSLQFNSPVDRDLDGQVRFLDRTNDQVSNRSISAPIEETSSATGRYSYPSTEPALLHNLSQLRRIKSESANVLLAALKDVQSEAEIAIECQTLRGKFYEANALANILADTPETYGVMAVHGRNKELEDSGRLEAIRLSEKQCGRLFLVIKCSTLPLSLNHRFVGSVSISDIEAAEQHLLDVIKRLNLPLQLPRDPGAVGEPAQGGACDTSIYYRIDPLWHRALTLVERNNTTHTLVSQNLEKVVWQRNLLDETSIHFALRQNLPAVLDLVCSEIFSQAIY